MFQFCCIGHLTLDTIITPAHTLQMAGGTAFYFSHAINSVTSSYQLITRVGEQEQYFVDALMQSGITVHAAKSPTSIHFENSYPQHSDDRVQRVLSKASPFHETDLMAVDASLIHLGPLLSDDMSTDFMISLAAKGKLSLDVQGLLRNVVSEQVVPAHWQDMALVLPHIHYLKLNEMELRQLTGEQDLVVGAHILLATGAKEIIVTSGSKGSFILHAEGLVPIPPYESASETDATGCGDTYMAGYLFQREQGRSVADAGHFASAMAALKMGRSGAYIGNMEEIYQLMQQKRKFTNDQETEE
jgi:sugar/nucleoside kinase (ribokinase family)